MLRAEGRLPEVLLTGGGHWGAQPQDGMCQEPGNGPSHGAQDQAAALTESTNPKELTIVLFHFIAKISTINLTTEKVSVSPASYSVSLRKHK